MLRPKCGREFIHSREGELKEKNKGTADIWVTPATAGRNDKWIQQKCFISTSIVKSNYWLKLEVLPWSWPWINKNMFEFQQMSLNFTYLSHPRKEKKDPASPFMRWHPHLRHRNSLQKWFTWPKTWNQNSWIFSLAVKTIYIDIKAKFGKKILVRESSFPLCSTRVQYSHSWSTHNRYQEPMLGQGLQVSGK